MTTVTNPTLLSTSDLFSRIRELAPRTAVFDCDGTLWSGDAGSGFMHWTIKTGLLSPEAVAHLNERYDGYKRGQVSELAICGEMVQIYSGLRVDDLRRAAAQFFREHIEPHIFPEMSQLVAELQRNGTEIWAVSSTCDWVVEEGMQRFHIPTDHVLAVCVECVDDVATDCLRDVPTDEGKVTALKRAGITAPDAVFGNSVHDAAMLAIARSAFPINPSPEFARLSAEHGWPVFYPQSVRPR